MFYKFSSYSLLFFAVLSSSFSERANLPTFLLSPLSEIKETWEQQRKDFPKSIKFILGNKEWIITALKILYPHSSVSKEEIKEIQVSEFPSHSQKFRRFSLNVIIENQVLYSFFLEVLSAKEKPLLFQKKFSFFKAYANKGIFPKVGALEEVAEEHVLTYSHFDFVSFENLSKEENYNLSFLEKGIQAWFFLAKSSEKKDSTGELRYRLPILDLSELVFYKVGVHNVAIPLVLHFEQEKEVSLPELLAHYFSTFKSFIPSGNETNFTLLNALLKSEEEYEKGLCFLERVYAELKTRAQQSDDLTTIYRALSLFLSQIPSHAKRIKVDPIEQTSTFL